jgi:hypothetical protein
MYEIENDEITEDFYSCWKAAGMHLRKQTGDGNLSWLRDHLNPPFREHLSFRLGNQLFFVRVEDVDGKVRGPGNPQGFITAAQNADGRACILPMKKKFFGGAWMADERGWGLLDAYTKEPINPVALITDQNIEMTPWEIQDMAVQVVRDYLAQQGFKLMAWQGDPMVDPSIWFLGKSKGLEWVLVRSAKHPAKSAERPKDWQKLETGLAKTGTVGHFASVGLVSVDQPFETNDEVPVPLFRGHGMHVRFTGLE